jgi:hypothetical protein
MKVPLHFSFLRAVDKFVVTTHKTVRIATRFASVFSSRKLCIMGRHFSTFVVCVCTELYE